MNVHEITGRSFECLLGRLSPDREEAGRRYEFLRRRLVRFFVWRRAANAEELADEVMNRLCRKFAQNAPDEGTVEAFALGIAQFVYREAQKQPRVVSLEGFTVRATPPPTEDVEHASRCLEACLKRLDPQSRRLVEAFYSEGGRAGTRARDRLAAELGIDRNALRVRMHRIRAKLEKWLLECLAQPG